MEPGLRRSANGTVVRLLQKVLAVSDPGGVPHVHEVPRSPGTH